MIRTFVIAVLLTGCAAPLASPTLEPTASPSPAPGVERMCEAFTVINEKVSPAYDDFTEDPIDQSFVGLAIISAGADIIELAEGVEPPELAADITRLGELYQAEGQQVGDGDLTGGNGAVEFYFEMVDAYDCG